VASLVVVAPSAAAADVLFHVKDPALADVAGLARDIDNELWWAVQPGLEATTVFGLDETGATAARLTYLAPAPNAAAVAWSSGALYIGDLADSGLERSSVQVFGIPAADAAGDKEVPYSVWELAYPDGPHDAGALLVSPTGRLIVVTAGEGAGFYGAPGELESDQPNILERLGDAPAGVTDGLCLSDRLIAVRTDTAVLTVDADAYTVMGEEPLDSPGQGLALSADQTALVVSGRGAGAAVSLVPVPTGLPSPPPSAPAETAAGARPADLSRSGTAIMMGAAAFLALCSGLLAFLRR
jgi:hypothetical protein